MSTIDLLNAEGEKGGTVELPVDLFDVTTNIPLIHQVVNAQLAAARQGTHATKTRGLVRGGGVKPWRQKGTGRARQGSRRAPQWAGGGTVFGPQPRSYAQKTPKRMIQAALLGVLSDRAREGRIVVLDAIVSGNKPSTKAAAAALAPFAQYRNQLLVLDRDDNVGWLSVRNLPEVHVVTADQLGAYDVVVSDVVVFTRAAIEVFAAAKGSAVKIKEVKAAKQDDAKTEKKAAKAKDGDEAVEDTKTEAKSATKKVKAQVEEVVEDVKTEAKSATKKVKAQVEEVVEDATAEATPVKKAAPKAKADKEETK